MVANFPVGLGHIVYESDYFCGANVLCYFEDVLVDDVVRIAWSVNQSRQPIYGYASQYFNALAAGVVIAGGSIWVAFKEAAYIPVILRHICSRRDGTDDLYASPAETPASGISTSTNLPDSAATWQGEMTDGNVRMTGLSRRASIERLMQAEAQNPNGADLQQFLTRYAVNISAMSDREFEDLAETFEDALWYGGNSMRSGRRDAMSGNFRGGELSDEAFLGVRRADQFPPFDIILAYGDMNTNASNHTLHRLIDVTITDTQNGPIEPSGEPLYVQYNFIARNVM